MKIVDGVEMKIHSLLQIDVYLVQLTDLVNYLFVMILFHIIASNQINQSPTVDLKIK